MTTLFDSTRPVKSARRFAAGLSAQRRKPFTARDLEWAAQELNAMEQKTGLSLGTGLCRHWLGPIDVFSDLTLDTDHLLKGVHHSFRTNDRTEDCKARDHQATP